ncbi:hypothetical protein [Pseudogemmobacter bohemicus]|uniref:hypothetical protein n=1 Tax=Pseudogemmobacter bohemicus TaxID=2250708 RepID=UPI0018E4FA24|nr:hypothetical protein [Pseudogemmobacter bohemicus]
MQLCEAVAARGVPMMAAMLLVSADMGICADSRSFARIFGVEHALVMRELVAMEIEMRLVTIPRRDTRSQRLHFALTPAAVDLLAHAGVQASGQTADQT